MKKIVFLLALGITIGFSAQAQKKLGYINSQELLEKMPEARKADTALQQYQKSLEDQFRTMATDAQAKFKEYEEKEKTWTDAVKEVKTKELQDLQNRIQEFQQGAEEKVAKKRQELFKPILDKAQKAIKDVGVEGGYDYIYDGGSLLYAKDTENILSAVKAKLGIK
ncbi:OmpH family outer membrane protein [Taibaiella chishuiensis]|uniref:Periplasmic chaperone for outer membrane proteins Skp n=1 Tax=Taibaiella chishuiensis TaxID=1434707 RepID=A0A2P8DAJ9_9BACT|nr:OmpH family outer membrane protein [Taibaiella chishuiensis]PSK94235.1 periplasmic chaperone for outer membrane proteins Skp [Taibaiella chishuiensis]